MRLARVARVYSTEAPGRACLYIYIYIYIYIWPRDARVSLERGPMVEEDECVQEEVDERNE